MIKRVVAVLAIAAAATGTGAAGPNGAVAGAGLFRDDSPTGSLVFFSVAIVNGEGTMFFRNPGQTGARYSVLGVVETFDVTDNIATVTGTCSPPDNYGPSGLCKAVFVDGGDEASEDSVRFEFDKYVHAASLSHGQVSVAAM